MESTINWTALSVFVFFFALVTVMGFLASRWQSGGTTNKGAHLDEWGLGGRNFGTWITWFLVGGDFYTAYTVIAVPALVYAVGAYGFFALPYPIPALPPRRVAPAAARLGAHRHRRDDALHRAAAGRHGGGDQGPGPDRRAAA